MALAAMVLGLMASSISVAAETPIYGSQLMTKQERIEHRNKLRAAKTVEERDQVRLQHHEQMQLRAKEKGVTLPDALPPMGGGQGRGTVGMGGMGGMGPGGRGANR
ncbi:MAG: hypothetical protein CFR70_05150 [Rhodocyclaceae bacterium]|nr:hypothetical protein [Dechloromonas sp.]TEX49028.1 MAG: hypothetical protein CFR70_05150 [Rhodocyclaceae bacterium]